MIAQYFTDGEMNIVLGNKSSSVLHVSVFETERDSVHEVRLSGFMYLKVFNLQNPLMHAKECKSGPSSLVRLVLSLA